MHAYIQLYLRFEILSSRARFREFRKFRGTFPREDSRNFLGALFGKLIRL